MPLWLGSPLSFLTRHRPTRPIFIEAQKGSITFYATIVDRILKAPCFVMTYIVALLCRCLLLPLLWLDCSFALAETSALAAANAPTQARYASLYHALEPGLIIARYDRLFARQRIVSRRTDVLPSQIEVRIMANAGVILVKVAADGSVNFPMNQALLTENPLVQSNQAKGSLSLSATMEIKLGQTKVLAYSDIYESARQAQQAIAALGPAMAGRNVRSIEFEFDPNLETRAEISDGVAEELLLADKQGFLILRIDEALAKRKAQVTFSNLPIAARPHID